MNRNIALIINYDGTDFCGWQMQKNRPSVQGALEKSLRELHGQDVPLIGAGRTDSGVHALGQVGHFSSGMDSIAGEQFADALNYRLPSSIRIIKSLEVSKDFHSRYSAIRRSYEYRMMLGPPGMPHLNRFVWQVPHVPSLQILSDMALEICGTHDFTTFTSAGDASLTRIRHIHHAYFTCVGPLIIFRISGNAFLWRMVRSLVGTMMNCSLRGGDGQTFRDILKACSRDAAGPTAPARGLFLSGVEYGPQWGFDPIQ